MCLGLPVQMRSIAGFEGEVEGGGVSRTTSFCLTPEARVGGDVYVRGGYAISAMDQSQGLESLGLER